MSILIRFLPVRIHAGSDAIGELLEQVIASMETYDPFEGMLEFPEWKEEDEGEGGSE